MWQPPYSMGHCTFRPRMAENKRALACQISLACVQLQLTCQALHCNGEYNECGRVCDIECSSLDQIIPLIAKWTVFISVCHWPLHFIQSNWIFLCFSAEMEWACFCFYFGFFFAVQQQTITTPNTTTYFRRANEFSLFSKLITQTPRAMKICSFVCFRLF